MEEHCHAAVGVPLVVVPWDGTLVVWAWHMVAPEGGGEGDHRMVQDQEEVVACMASDSMASLEWAGDRDIYIIIQLLNLQHTCTCTCTYIHKQKPNVHVQYR